MEIIVQAEYRYSQLGRCRAHRKQLKRQRWQVVWRQFDDIFAELLQHRRLLLFGNVHFTVDDRDV